ncbi:TOMM precursor leader peptide-binding protein [Kitasatospora sp. LaBMicrA B282]|uniref:TOMM precursor leader peptide-binding protein n=1 Tax=Kitasatospora sp. LaBMicrA B282 TaxID=3420949 RepID=UPI003D152410
MTAPVTPRAAASVAGPGTSLLTPPVAPPLPPPGAHPPVLTAEAALAAVAGSAVVLLDEWSPGLAAELSRHALAHPVVQVPVRCDGALIVVGPVLRPGAGACLSCTEYQRLATAGGRVPWQSPRLALGGLIVPALDEAVLTLAAELLADANTDTPPDPPIGATVHVVHGDRATWSTHHVRPVGGCPVCAPLPPDTAAAARVPLTPRPLPDPSVLRQPNARLAPDTRTGADPLRAALHDERFGPVRRLVRTEDSAFSLTSAYVADGRAVDDGGYGRAADFGSSERVALFEAVERFAGMRPTGRRTALRAAYARLGPERALDPARLGLPDPTYHGHPASSTVPYHPELELDWVHGWSLTRDRPLLLPEHVAYWDVPGTDRPRVVYESSNGCGLGNSPEEAALYGLFEVAERDAFLMAWYAATPLPRIALPAEDLEVRRLADRAALSGYRLILLDATNDLGIPAVVAVCRYRGRHPDAPRCFLAAGAHHDPRSAIRSAVIEVVTTVQAAARRASSSERPYDPERLHPMLTRPELVRTLDDHVGLNTLPAAQPRLAFLFADTPERDWRAAWPGAPAPVADLTGLLTGTVQRLAGLGLEVLVVRQDEPGVRDRLGLYCAKVVVPGTLPMTFGHVHHRTQGLPRLLEVPHRLGRTERPLRPSDLTIHPHPFP